jgi:2-polyprenyl-6-hydroxyphenyl methylase / 3-demethylubiquinone-9 3-methyltransferase
VISSKGYTNVVGMDISPKSLEAASKIDKLSTYVVGSIYKIPLPKESADVVILSDVMAHLFDLRPAFQEINRILKPGGLIIFESITRTFWSHLMIKVLAENLGFIPKDTHDYRMFVSPEDLKKLFSEFNFEMKTFSGIQISFGVNENWKIFVKSSYLLEEFQVRDTFIGYGIKK